MSCFSALNPERLSEIEDSDLCFLFFVFLSQDWQEIVSLYEADNVYLGECNIHPAVPMKRLHVWNS